MVNITSPSQLLGSPEEARLWAAKIDRKLQSSEYSLKEIDFKIAEVKISVDGVLDNQLTKKILEGICLQSGYHSFQMFQNLNGENKSTVYLKFNIQEAKRKLENGTSS